MARPLVGQAGNRVIILDAAELLTPNEAEDLALELIRAADTARAIGTVPHPRPRT